MSRKRFWQFNAKKDQEDTGELLLYGEISSSTWYGDEVTPKQFKEDLDALGDIKTLHVFINSAGGDVFAGHAIYNILSRHPAERIVHVDGVAASIASLIAMAGHRIVMPRNAMMMIHRAWTIGVGNANDMRKLADDLDKIDESIVAVYASRTHQDPEAILSAMDKETWMSAQEAVLGGFADEIEADREIAACLSGPVLTVNGLEIDTAAFRKVPDIRATSREIPANTYKAKLVFNERKMRHEL
jgi:ATP-dependent Clp protease protease subunit